MDFLLEPWQFFFAILAGWVNHEQQEVIDYLRAENAVLKELHGPKRILLKDDQRRRLAAKGNVATRNVDAAVPSLKGRKGVVNFVGGHYVRVRFETHGDGKDGWWCNWGEGLRPVEAADAKTPTVASDLKVTPGACRVLAYLQKHGDISPLKAMTVLGVGRLASCIHELRTKAGYKITTEIREDDGGHRYGTYYLKQPVMLA